MTRRPLSRTALLVGAAGVLLTLSACTAAPETSATSSAAAPSTSAAVPSSPAATPSATASASPSGTPDPSASALDAATQRYLGFVQQFSPALAGTDPQVLLELGGGVCAGFEAGEDAGAIAVAIGDDPRAPDLEASDAAVILGAAVATLCPQFQEDLAG